MEVLRLLKTAPPPLNHPPQDAPIDLTTGGRICPSALLQSVSFPHLRFHSKALEDLGSDHTSLKLEAKEKGMTRDFKENQGMIVRPFFHGDRSGSRKRRLDEVNLTSENRPLKKHKFESESSKCDVKQSFPFSSHLESKIKSEKDQKHFPLNSILDPGMPLNILECMTQLDKIKSSEPSSATIQETKALLAAVQQSQMLYYSYCSKLIQNLHSRRLLEEQESIKTTATSTSTQALSRRPLATDTPATDTPSSSISSEERPPSNGTQCSGAHKSPVSPRITSESPSSSSSSTIRTSGVPPALDESPACPTASPASTPQLPPSADGRGQASSQPTAASLEAKGRRRAPRALTGKHVRPGTGASLFTLKTLRLKLEERLNRPRTQPSITQN